MNLSIESLAPEAIYPLLVGAITPRPIAWISTLNRRGALNLAPYSFFTVASCYPPVLSVTQVNPRNRAAKDTLTNLQTQGECVINIVSADLAEQMNASCADYAADISEVEALAIATCASHLVQPAGVKAARVRYECRLREVIAIATEPLGGTLMLLDVVSIYVDDGLLVDQKIMAERLDTIGKLGGDDYCTTRTRFSLQRPVLG